MEVGPRNLEINPNWGHDLAISKLDFNKNAKSFLQEYSQQIARHPECGRSLIFRYNIIIQPLY